MPRLSEAMKDVISCDKAAGIGTYELIRSISEWGNPLV